MDGELTKRTPKAGGVAYDFTSSFFASGNAMRLATIHGSDGGDYRFYYDSFSRLVSHHWPAPRGGFDNLYYDGPDVALERRRTAAGDQWLRYVHGQRDDQPLATEVYAIGAPPTPGTGQQFYYHADGEGSIRVLTDAAGQVANRYDYDSFGRRVAATESLTNQPYGWKGREWIAGPDIYYNRARFYDPVLGRLMSQDPLGYRGGDFNLYSFGWNNPKRWNDPSGWEASEYALQLGPFAANAIGQATSIGSRLNCIFGTLATMFDLINQGGDVTGISTSDCKVSAQFVTVNRIMGALNFVSSPKVQVGGMIFLSPWDAIRGPEIAEVSVLLKVMQWTDSNSREVSNNKFKFGIPDITDPLNMLDGFGGHNPTLVLGSTGISVVYK